MTIIQYYYPDLTSTIMDAFTAPVSYYRKLAFFAVNFSESHVIDEDPTIFLDAKGGGVPQEERQALTDEQVKRLLDAIRDLPPYVFVMIGLYAGLRREEILALQWDSVYLDAEAPYLTV